MFQGLLLVNVTDFNSDKPSPFVRDLIEYDSSIVAALAQRKRESFSSNLVVVIDRLLEKGLVDGWEVNIMMIRSCNDKE